MGGTGRLLDNDEVEFLLKGGGESTGPADQPGRPENRGEAAREVTMRGDLDKINLSDIFQTLAMSKMEGILRVRGPIESREVHFRDGFVRCIVPRRVETLRLGQRLVRAGHVSAEQLRSALLEQRKSRKSLGDILVEQQLVTHDDIDDIVANQLQEDLFALFTWPQGTFEFYKGAVDDPVHLARLQQTPSFEVNGVLLEVARRSDEWMCVMDAVGNLDELLVPVDGIDFDLVGEDERLVLDAANRQHSVRDLADVTLLGLFECGRVVRQLLLDGLLRKLSIEEGLDAAVVVLEAGEPRRAVMAIRALLERGEALDVDTTKRVGDVLTRCGESRRGAAVVLQAAEQCADASDALDLARHARGLDKLSADVLLFLASALQQTEDSDPAEIADVHADLADALADRGDHEGSLRVVEQLEEQTGDLVLCRPRKARVLAKLGRPGEAVEALLGLAELLRERGDKERVVATYEQILKIDYRRKDVARALKNLHASKIARRGKFVAIAATFAAIGFVGYVQLDGWRRNREAAGIHEQVAAALAAGELDRANSLVQQASIRFADSEQLVEMQAELQRSEANRRSAATAEIGRIRERTRTDAAARFDEGRAPEALDALSGLSSLGIGESPLLETVRLALAPLQNRLVQLDRQLQERMPPEASIEQTVDAQAVTLNGLTTMLATPDIAAALSLSGARDHQLLRAALGKEYPALCALLDSLSTRIANAKRLEHDYSGRLERRTLAKELTPLFHEAREHERAFRFEAALEAYRTLARNHPEDDELKAHFEERVERYSTILRFLKLIDEATARGDFAAAQGQLRALGRQFPEPPFESIARLPVRVRTTPPGARVFVDGQPVGEAPVLTSYRPAAQTRIRVELDGFQPEETTLKGDTVGIVRSLLARLPAWVAHRDATVDRPPTIDNEGRMFVADRAGTVSCLRVRDGAVLWNRTTDDLSGLLTKPSLCGEDRLVVASIDGPLRCLRRQDGTVLWLAPDLPTESSPAWAGPVIMVATDDARAVGVAASDGRVVWSATLPGPVQADLVEIDERLVIAVTTLGAAVGIDPADGHVKWTARIGRGAVCTPAHARGLLAVVTEDGSATLLDARTGNARWSVSGFANLSLTPAILDDRVVVADGRDLQVLELSNGRRRTTVRGDADLRSPLSVAGDVLLVGDSTGEVRALATSDLEPMFVLRADGPALAPIVTTADGTLIGAFQDRTIRAFAAIPR